MLLSQTPLFVCFPSLLLSFTLYPHSSFSFSPLGNLTMRAVILRGGKWPCAVCWLPFSACVSDFWVGELQSLDIGTVSDPHIEHTNPSLCYTSITLFVTTIYLVVCTGWMCINYSFLLMKVVWVYILPFKIFLRMLFSSLKVLIIIISMKIQGFLWLVRSSRMPRLAASNLNSMQQIFWGLIYLQFVATLGRPTWP